MNFSSHRSIYCRMFIATAKRLRVLKSSDLPPPSVSLPPTNHHDQSKWIYSWFVLNLQLMRAAGSRKRAAADSWTNHCQFQLLLPMMMNWSWCGAWIEILCSQIHGPLSLIGGPRDYRAYMLMITSRDFNCRGFWYVVLGFMAILMSLGCIIICILTRDHDGISGHD